MQALQRRASRLHSRQMMTVQTRRQTLLIACRKSMGHVQMQVTVMQMCV